MSSPSPRPAKRQREESPPLKVEADEGLVPTYEHHELFFYNDGNLVVVAQSEPLPTAFKIYRGLLAKSTVLEEQLARLDDAVTYSGAPVLFLNDPASYVEGMLRWLSSKMFDFSLPKQAELDDVFGYYELGVKYGLDDMREEGLSRLTSCYPPALSDYEKRPAHDSPDRTITDFPSQEFDVAAFAARHGLHLIAPVALYDCCVYTSPLDDLVGDCDDITDTALFSDGTEPRRWVQEHVLKGADSSEMQDYICM
ncbi:hypothetical protein K488DRAFT_90532 [Vararia minispora EC-137]|uniref:Uncharacterized protein n=1 Tax=Vararia minispora EC-137 TaxID=1314806 RepID=A0ACB8Q913_9AGAM|nr:hypothetical protein K488DRAFT_90532 [Vararia minispora EC-137]